MARLAIRIDKPLAEEKQLFLEGFVSVQIAGVPFKQVFMVPDRAFNNGRVFVVDAEDRLAARQVEIVHRSPGFAFVASGLSEGDELVISRMRNPLAGTKVKRTDLADGTPAEQASACKGSSHDRPKKIASGPIAWMARNAVVANLLMGFMLIAGALSAAASSRIFRR